MSNKEKPFIGNAIEGESYVGKSTALEKIKELRDLGVIVVPEYAVVGKFIDFPRETVTDVRKAVARIIEIEKKRTEILNNALAKTKDSIVLFDRGPISCIAFEHAAQKAGFRGAALWMAEAFQKEVADKEIIVPIGMIHLTASREVIEQRNKANLSMGRGEIMEFLRDIEVIKTINTAFQSFGKHLPEQMFLTLQTDNKGPEEVSANILQFVTAQTAEVEHDIPNFISYAKSLI